jgi:hypothetical protein
VNLANPLLALVGVGLASLPVIVHLLTRPRPVQLPFSAMRFLSEVEAARRRRSRLRDALVLGLRTTAVVALALAVGRLRAARGVDEAAPDEPLDRVVVVDVSRSMNARSGGGVTAIERARARARAHLGLRMRFRAGLVLAGATARPVFDELSENVAALVQELGDLRAAPVALDAGAALAAAARLLAARSGAPRRHEVVVVTDLQATSWERADFAQLPEDTALTFDSVAPDVPPANVAVTGVRLAERAERGRAARLGVEVANFSGLARRLELEVRVGSRTFRPGLEIGPWERRVEAVEVVLSDEGAVDGLAAVATAGAVGDGADALREDDHRSFVVRVSPPPAIGIVSEQPPLRAGTSAYFIHRALAPDGDLSGGGGGGGASGADSGRRVIRIATREARKEVMDPLDTIVLVRPGKLPEELVKLAAGLVVRGAGLLYAAQEPVDADNLRRLVEELGNDVAIDVAFGPERRGAARPVHLRPLSARGPPFDAFSEGLMARLMVEPCRRRLDSSPGAGSGPPRGLLARYSDGASALSVADAGGGRIAVLNMDVAGSPLARSPLFVPLVNEIQAMLQRRGALGGDDVATGTEMSVLLPHVAGAAAGLEVRGPDSRAVPGLRIEETAAGAVLRGRASVPGVHRVVRRGATVHALAVECPAGESDLRTLDAASLRARTDARRHVRVRVRGAGAGAGAGAGSGARSAGDADGEEPRSDLWPLLLLAAAACVLCEIGVLKLFRT